MLLRIAPQMFIDKKYQCVTITDIHNEIVRTAKFKTKYPWVKGMRGKLKTIALTSEDKKREDLYFGIVKSMIYEGTINQLTGGLFDLSRPDMKIVSHCLALKYKCTSGDGGLVQFLEQEFSDDFQGNVTPLEIINTWLDNGTIKWTDKQHAILMDWETQNEKPQPPKAKKEFQQLTGRNYDGP
jgi:hypothetical protein